MALPPAFLDDLRSRTPLHGLIGGKVRLDRNGRQWKGCCPFHNEKTPSFYVYDDHFHCFGCGAHGDAIAFLMRAEGASFREVVERLAAEAGLEVPASVVPGPPAPPAPGTAADVELATMVARGTGFDRDQLEAVLATAARLLVSRQQAKAAAILANARCVLRGEYDGGWDNGPDRYVLDLALPADVYAEREDWSETEVRITGALAAAMRALPSKDHRAIAARIVVLLDQDPDWRRKVRQQAAGNGTSNQGRVRSDNVAARQHEGLLFRSEPEIHFYNALKRTGVPFAPLSVVLRGGVIYKRTEPDFLLFRNGLFMVVEIDGDLFHRENPAHAHERLKFLTDEGAALERIDASACDTPEKAKETATRVLATMDKHRRSR